MPPSLRALLASLALCLPSAVFAVTADPAATLSIAPPPAWVEEADAEALRAPIATASDAEAYLLVDRQVNLASAESYFRVVREVRTASGVQEGSTVLADYDPSFERLTFHRIEVVRDGTASSRLSRKSIELLRRESSLEWQLIDGTVTATVVLQDIRPGDRIDVAYTLKGFNPALGGRYDDEFLGGWSEPVGRVRLRILSPVQRLLRFGPRAGAAEPTRAVRGGTVEHLWELADTPAVPDEDLTPPWHLAVPWLQVSEFADWAAVAEWARSLFPAAPLSEELEHLVAGWRQRYESPEDRALAAVDWVQRNIRYVGIELGAGSYRPSPPSTVASRRFGDCKDQVYLLCTMLGEMAMEAAPVLISTWARDLLSDLLPSPRPFDHVIARVMLGDRAVLVDPTQSFQRGPLADRYLPDYGHGLVVSEGQHALAPLGPQGIAPEVEVVERIRAGARGEPSELTVETTSRGGAADTTRWQFATSRLEEIARSYLNYYASRYPGIESAGEIVFDDDEAANLCRVTERYRVPEFWVEASGGARAELLADAIVDAIPTSETKVRSTPLWVDFPRRVVQRMEIELPEEWPEDSETETFTNAAFELGVHHEVSGRSVAIAWDYRSLAAEVPVAEIAGYQKALRELDPSLSFELTWGNDAYEGGLSPLALGTGVAALALSLAAAALAYRRVSGPAPASPQSAPPPETVAAVPLMRSGEDAPSGLGGWLVPVAVGLFARPFASAFSIAQLVPVLSAGSWHALTNPAGGAYHPAWAPVLLFELVAYIALAVASLLLLVLYFQRRRSFPPGFIALLVAQAAVTIVDLVAGTIVGGKDDSSSSIQSMQLMVVTLASSAAWSTYLLRSRRVRLTFVR